MMRAYASDTSVPVEKTKMEIDSLLAKHGCQSRGIQVDDAQCMAAVAFVLSGLKYRVVVPMPTRESVRKQKAPPGGWTPDKRERRWDQACRSRWRSMLLLLRAKFEAVRMGVSSTEREFMPDLVLPNGKTVLVEMGHIIQEGLTAGKMPALMLPESSAEAQD